MYLQAWSDHVFFGRYHTKHFMYKIIWLFCIDDMTTVSTYVSGCKVTERE